MAGYIHQFAAPMLLGHDPLAIELHWRRLYEVIAHSVGKGAELRGLSAIDVARSRSAGIMPLASHEVVPSHGTEAVPSEIPLPSEPDFLMPADTIEQKPTTPQERTSQA